MFETAEVGHAIAKETFKVRVPRLRSELLHTHFDLKGRRFPVIVVVSGADAAGKGEVVHRLNEWLDPRGVETHAFWQVSDEERERPPYWRFWRVLPGRGRIGILFGSWYTEPIIRRVYGEIDDREFDRALARIASFEEMLVADGALIVKLWLHLSKREQKKALKKLESKGRIAPREWKQFKLYDEFTKISERAIRHTDSGAAPWHLVEATDRRYRELTIGTILLDAIQRRLESEAAPAVQPRAKPSGTRNVAASILDQVDVTQKLTETEYREQLVALQAKLAELSWAALRKNRSTVMVFEGWDAAGKGSAIRRVTQAIDPRLCRIVGIAAPTDEERAQHYLWRFWRCLPRAGFTTIFDRSWYGRVLVERVEGFASRAEWSRAYLEINDFEEQLAESAIVVCKFWIHISQDEQLRRFRERQKTTYKRYKITEEDWRNRKKWNHYKAAVDEMVTRCSTELAPWTLVPGNDKKFGRVQILATIVRRLEEAL
jgi:polyphosphate:AMP phosphotransferase